MKECWDEMADGWIHESGDGLAELAVAVPAEHENLVLLIAALEREKDSTL
jgi:hypothetical protein